MNRKKQPLILFALVLMVLPVFVNVRYNSTTVVAQADPDRGEIMWATGYDSKADGSFYPFSDSPAYGLAFMYEPLFGANTVSGDLIPVLGTGTSFADMWNENGSSITVTLNEHANWSDDEPVTADDVIFTYNICNVTNGSRWALDMQERIAGINKVDEHTVQFDMKEGYEFSLVMEGWLSLDIPILPEHVWTEIIDDYSQGYSHDPTTGVTGITEAEFKNYWLDSEFPEAWKVSSGPYHPYSIDTASTTSDEIYALREDWWGKGLVHTAADLNKSSEDIDVKFVGIKFYPDNAAKDNALKDALIDMHAGAITDPKNFEVTDGEALWYYGTDPSLAFVPLSGNIALSPNNEKWPFNQLWMRQAMAYAINKDPITRANKVWAKAENGILNPNNPAHEDWIDVDALTTYSYDPEKAREILEENCYQKDGEWYAKDGVGPAGVDDDPDTDGEQALLQEDTWDVIVPTGWTDTIIAVESWVETIGNALDVDIAKSEVDFWNNWRVDLNTGEYDLAMQCCTPKTVEDPFVLFGGFRGTASAWQNESRWQGTKADEFEAKYELLETAAPADRAELAQDMCVLYSEDIPSIITHTNAIWHTVNTKYWTNWNTYWNQYNQLIPANTVNQIAAKCRVALALEAADGTETYPVDMTPEDLVPPEEETETEGIAWSGLPIAAMIGIAATLSVVIRKYHKQ